MSRRQRGEWLPRTWLPSVRSAVSQHTPDRPGNPRHCHLALTFTPPPPAGCVRPPPPLPSPPAPAQPLTWVMTREGMLTWVISREGRLTHG